MAYEPALVGLILAGTVGGLAVVMSVSADWEVSHELARATQGWTLVMVARTYDAGELAAGKRAPKEASILLQHGYEPVVERDEPAMPEPGGDADGQGATAPGGLGTVGRITVRYRLGATRT